jgi:hypothetical protein
VQKINGLDYKPWITQKNGSVYVLNILCSVPYYLHKYATGTQKVRFRNNIPCYLLRCPIPHIDRLSDATGALSRQVLKSVFLCSVTYFLRNVIRGLIGTNVPAAARSRRLVRSPPVKRFGVRTGGLRFYVQGKPAVFTFTPPTSELFGSSFPFHHRRHIAVDRKRFFIYLPFYNLFASFSLVYIQFWPQHILYAASLHFFWVTFALRALLKNRATPRAAPTVRCIMWNIICGQKCQAHLV